MRIKVLALLSVAALATGGCDMFGRSDSGGRAETSERDRERDRDRERSRDGERNKSEDREERAASDDEPSRTAARDPDEITEAWLIGRWADSPDCESPIEFREGGRFVTADGGGGRWSVRNGDTVVFTGPGGRNELRLRRVNANQVEVVDGTGGSWRCD
jgi:hypothetical protein